MKKRGIYFLLVCCVLTCGVYADETQAKDNSIENSKIRTLKKLLSGKGDQNIAEIVKIMEDAASTKRFDAAILLIDGLKYNYSPLASNEARKQEDLVPAIGILKRYYGSEVCPLLLFRGVTSTNHVLIERCALALRTILTTKEVNIYKEAFFTSKSNQTNFQIFGKLLTQKDFKIKIETCDDKNIIKIDNVIQEMKLKQKKQKSN